MDTHHLIGPSEAGSVVVDIGSDVGAAVVRAPASLAGAEIEIRRCGAPWDGTHVAVRVRHVLQGDAHVAFFPDLIQGNYEVRRRGDDDGAVAALTVEGGRVSEIRLSPSA
jgi:hypothetical protein